MGQKNAIKQETKAEELVLSEKVKIMEGLVSVDDSYIKQNVAESVKREMDIVDT